MVPRLKACQSLLVAGFSFSFADVVTGAVTIISSSGLIPLIVNGGGLLADNGSQQLAFEPSGGGDASLDLFIPGEVSNFEVAWVAGTAEVPEPSTVGLIGLDFLVSVR